jgi:trigger factor
MYGREIIVDEMLDKIGNDLYQEALKESELDPYAAAHLNIVERDPLSLKFTVPVQPVVTLGDYHKLRVKVKAVRVKKADVEEVLHRMQEGNAIWVPAERDVQLGDQVQLDAEGVTETGHKTDSKDLTVEIREQMTPPEFGQNLVGLQAGESKEFDVAYPAEYGDENLAGKRVHFHVLVKGVKAKELPELNDDLAKNVGSETMAKLRKRIQEELRTQKEAEAKDAAISEALDALVEDGTLEYPSVAVEHEAESMVESYTNRLRQQGFTLEGYLEMTGKTPEQFHEELHPQAERRLKRTLVLAKFAQAEGVQADPTEVEHEIETLSQPYGEKAGEVKSLFSQGEPLVSITNDVFRRKALDRLLAMGTGRSEVTKGAKQPTEAAADVEESAEDK